MKSDRFFLNQSPNDVPSQYGDISRSEYLKKICGNEDVQCLVFGTYRVEKTCFESEFLNHIDSDNIPILVLHGRRPLDEEEGDRSSDWAAQIPFLNNQDDKLSVWEVLPSFKCSDGSFQLTYGCHHPKFLLIFTTKGMHISISTSNLTNTVSVDGTWAQFFPRNNESNLATSESDFGVVLEDFLQKESENLRYNIENEINVSSADSYNILRWIGKHTKVASVATGYDFSEAQVDLVTTVPCRQPLPQLSDEEIEWLYRHHRLDPIYRKPEPCCKCRQEQNKLLPPSEVTLDYSSFRVNAIAKQREREFPRPLKSSDFLIAQPTSIGGLMNNQYIASWLEALMPDEYWLRYPDKLRQDSWRLIWPSNAYMEEVKKEVVTNKKQKKPHGEELQAAGDDSTAAEVVLRTGIVFLNPKIFALMEPDVQAAFHTYEPNSVSSLQLNWKKVPHIKTYTRLMQGVKPVTEKLKNIHVVPHCICWKVAWCWLTSACLSKGAQGEEVPYSICSDCRHVRQGYREFKNFELGVLFRSTRARQYLALNNACPVCTRSKPFQKITASREEPTARKSDREEARYSSLAIIPKRYLPVQNITLPLPFHLSQAKPYCDSRGKLVIDPYFHEDLQLKNQLAGSKSDGNPSSSGALSIKRRQFSFPGSSLTKRKLPDDVLAEAMKKAHSVDSVSPLKAATANIVDLTGLEESVNTGCSYESQCSVQSVVLVKSVPVTTIASPPTAVTTTTTEVATMVPTVSPLVTPLTTGESCSTKQSSSKPLSQDCIRTIATIPQYHTMMRHASASPTSPSLDSQEPSPQPVVSVHKKLSFAFRMCHTNANTNNASSPQSVLMHSHKLCGDRSNSNTNENTHSQSNSLTLSTEESVVISV